MFRIVFLLILLSHLGFQSAAQNLIPDPGFEDWDGSMGVPPNTLSALNSWYVANGTPDHHHQLNPAGVALSSLEDCPLGNGQNQCGVPYEGQAILATYKGNSIDGAKEWAGTELVPAMQNGVCYAVSFWIQNKKDKTDWLMETNQWGMFFSNTEFPAFDPNTADFSTMTNQFVTCEQVIDGSEWHHVEFTYTADDNYAYAYLGYMGNVVDATEVTWSTSGSVGFYVWFDAVEVVPVLDPELTPGPDLTVCTDDDAFIYAESNMNITWDTGYQGDTLWLDTTTPGVFTYDVFAGEGSDCELMETISVTVEICCQMPITGSATEVNDTTCPNDLQCNGSATAIPDSGLPPFTYQWDDPNAQVGAVANNLCPGIYNCTIEDSGGCVVVVEAVITGLEPAVVSIVTTPVTCVGLSDGTITTIPISGEQPFTYEWDNNPTGPNIDGVSSGMHFLEITDNNSCVYNEQAFVDPPVYSIIDVEVPGEYCLDSEPFILVPSLGPGVWSGPGIIDPATGEFSPIQAGAGQQTVTFVPENICDLEYSVKVIVRPEPNVNFNASVEIGCPALDVVFDIPGFHTEGIYDWDFGDGSIGNEEPPFTHVYNQSGTYDVSLEVTDGFGCQNSKSETNYIHVAEVPEAAFSFTPDELTDYDNVVQFTDESEGAISWYWDFGNGQTSTQRNPEMVYDTPGIYTVELSVISNGYCPDSVRHTVKYPGEVLLWIPNAFTPDGDGINDVFRVVSNDYFTSYEIYIYDRWGNVVFHSTDVNEVWVGDSDQEFSKTGEAYYQDNDLYNYIITYNATFANGGNLLNEVVTGHVTLIR